MDINLYLEFFVLH